MFTIRFSNQETYNFYGSEDEVLNHAIAALKNGNCEEAVVMNELGWILFTVVKQESCQSHYLRGWINSPAPTKRKEIKIMFMMKEMAIMDIKVRDYGGGISKTRLYIPFEDLPWDYDTEEFQPETDEDAWNWWKEEIEKEICGIGIVKVEFKVLESWGKNELRTFHVKEF